MYQIEYFIVKLLYGIFQHISLSAGKQIANIIYFLTYHLFRYRRKVIINNLRMVYGDNLPKPLDELLKGIYKNFIFLWMEFLQNNKVVKENLFEIFTVHNPEIFEDAYNNKKGVILVSGHMGNFEWLGQMHGQMGNKIYGIAKKLKNPLVNELVEKNRLRENMGVVYTKKAIKEGMEVLKNKNLLAIVMDQDAKKKGVFIDFLGLPSSAAVGPAVFHLKTGAPLIFLMSIRKDYGQFDAYYEEICPVSEPVEVTDEKIKEITQKHMSVLEKWVRLYPEQWFWMHRRWKTKLKTESKE